MKKALILLSIILMLALVACGGGTNENSAATAAPAATEETVAPTEAPAGEAVEDVSAQADVGDIDTIRIAAVMPSCACKPKPAARKSWRSPTPRTCST